MPKTSFVSTLFSSSGGNCVYIKNKNEEFLIDAGVSARAIETALKTLGTSLSNIRAIFVTHEHSDHIKGLGTISKHFGIPVYAPAPCLSAIEKSHPCTRYVLNALGGETVLFGETAFSHFRTPHDSLSSCGFVADLGDKRVGVATDMGYITKETAAALAGCHAVVIESNHDLAMLRNGSYPPALKNRVEGEKGHLSNAACAEFLPFLAVKGVKAFALAHLSAENNTPKTAFLESYHALSQKGVTVCKKDSPGDVFLTVAPRAGVCALIDQ